MKIAFIGTGYVGLVSATAFAEMGNEVICVDVDSKKVEKLCSGKLTIYEPGLEDLFMRNVRDGRLKFTTQLADAVLPSDVIFLTLPTPPQEDGSADLSYVMKVINQLPAITTDYKVIVTKSTVPVGTADTIRKALEELGLQQGVNFDIVSNPEFLREGSALNDFMKPERVVIGTSSQPAATIMRQLYEPFVRNGNPIQVMDERSAELVKYASNGFLALKISFINEIANLCERVGADVENVRKGMGKDSRIGSQFLYAGLGYGGSCFPKDVQALSRTSKKYDYEFKILDAVMQVNQEQREHLLAKIESRFNGKLAGKKMAVWGLSFKQNTDDVREAPALWLIEKLIERGVIISAYDPEGMANARVVLGDTITWGKDQYEILEEKDALVICTEWNEFRTPDFKRVQNLLNGRVVFDGRNLFEPAKMANLGFEYYAVGRPFHTPLFIERENQYRIAG